jgi:hypothetical protein
MKWNKRRRGEIDSQNIKTLNMQKKYFFISFLKITPTYLGVLYSHFAFIIASSPLPPSTNSLTKVS